MVHLRSLEPKFPELGSVLYEHYCFPLFFQLPILEFARPLHMAFCALIHSTSCDLA